MDANQQRKENLLLAVVSIGLSIAILVFHLICVYSVWNDHGSTSAGVSLFLPWLAEAYWTYYDFSWLYLGFVIIGGIMIVIRKIISLSLEDQS
jgi:hypothetical protein